jgi:hypothetical protein
MNEFVQRHASSVTATLSGFDRMRFRGTLRMLAHAGGFGSFLRVVGVTLKDFGDYVEQTTRQITEATRRLAEAAGRPLRYLASAAASKEQLAREIAQADGITDGLICVISCVEPCFSYTLRPFGTPQLLSGMRKCLHWYHYFMHPQLGFMHARLQSWFPLTMHVCVNGRALNPLAEQDAALLAAAARGEFLLNGMRNRDLRQHLFGPCDDPTRRRKQSAAVTRKLRLLRAHGLIRKVAGTHRYLLSDRGRHVITALLAAREADVEKLLAA